MSDYFIKETLGLINFNLFMKISYNWLKWYIPEVPEPEKMWDIFTYHLCEVEGVEKMGEGEKSDTIFDINILPNRAHDLLSHQGVARELASLLNIKYQDPTALYKVPESSPTNLTIKIESDKCPRYMARIVRNVEIKDSPEWVRNHLESIGQRSINNVVDATNITMYDSGQPTHCFDLDKITGGIVVRNAKDGEVMVTLDNKEIKLNPSNMVIADDGGNVLALAGVKGGKHAEVDKSTKNILIEVANFDSVSVRKTRRMVNIFTDSAKRFENGISPELCDLAMKELAGLFVEYGFTDFEETVDVYKEKQIEKSLSFRLSKISKILGLDLKQNEVEGILKRYNFEYKIDGDVFEIKVPKLRLDLNIEEDMAEEIGRIMGYEKVIPKLPKIDFQSKQNETYNKILWARNKLLNDGYSEVMTYTFANKGQVEVLASASDKKFLRTNISDGLKESIKLNQVNLPLLNSKDLPAQAGVKVFEIGTVFKKDKEEMNVCFGDKKEVKEMSLEEFAHEQFSSGEHGYFEASKFLELEPSLSQVSPTENIRSQKFTMWSLFPFITRDIALWVPVGTDSGEVEKIIKENINELVVKGPELFDSFTKENKTSYAFRLVFQSYERTLTDEEVNKIIQTITEKLKINPNWELR